MESSTSPDAKRARKSTHLHQSFSHKREVDATKQQKEQQQQQQQPAGERPCGSNDSAVVAEPRSMTARPDGAAVEGKEDAIFDELVVREELEGLMGEPPSVSNESALALIKKHATTHPVTIRDFIAETAARLAIESGCVHEAPLVTWKDKSALAETCGQHQSRLLGQFDLQRVLDRQTKHDGAPCYLLAKRVRNQLYYDTSTDLLCVGQGNQCPAGPCMIAALKVFAGKGEDGIPREIVSAMCKY